MKNKSLGFAILAFALILLGYTIIDKVVSAKGGDTYFNSKEAQKIIQYYVKKGGNAEDIERVKRIQSSALSGGSVTDDDVHYLCETFKSNPVKVKRDPKQPVSAGEWEKESRQSTLSLSALNAILTVSVQNTGRKRLERLSEKARNEIFETATPCLVRNDRLCLGASIFIVDMLKDDRAVNYVAPYVNDKSSAIRTMARRTLSHYGVKASTG